jgi:hypothetical protein
MGAPATLSTESVPMNANVVVAGRCAVAELAVKQLQEDCMSLRTIIGGYHSQ